MNRHPQQKFPVIGGSSLLVIFAVLCLTVFALLGFSTVQADKRLADISAQAVSDYYRADSQAEGILACLRIGEIPEDVKINGNIYSYHCKISPTQILLVQVEKNSWEVLRWQAVSSVHWQADESMDLWNGER